VPVFEKGKSFRSQRTLFSHTTEHAVLGWASDLYLLMRQAPHAENCWREDLGWAEARRVVVEGYGGLAEPGLLGTEADLRGMGE
jgi:hypothetical protein